MSREDHKRDLYYKRKYNRSLKWYKRTEKKQNYRCAICGWKRGFNEKTGKRHNPLAVDHWHKLAKVKVKAHKTSKGLWKAYNIEFKMYEYRLKEAAITFHSSNRRKAVKAVKRILLRKSVRGLICWACNSGLRKWLDNPKSLRRAAQYLNRHQRG